MLRLALIVIILVSTLLAVAVGGLWFRSRTTWETAYVRTGGWFWGAYSGLGSATVHWYGGWPSPPNYLHHIADHDATKGVGPVFAVHYAGAARSKWQFGPVDGEYGTTRVVVDPSGSVCWSALGLPILKSFATARLSPLFRFWSITLPYWAVIFVLLLPLAGLIMQPVITGLIRHSRQRHRRCPWCAKDVHFYSDKCPECGHAVT